MRKIYKASAPTPTGTPNLAVQVDEAGRITVIDLSNGRWVRLEGITFAHNCVFKANPTQTKLLWVEWGEDSQNRSANIPAAGLPRCIRSPLNMTARSNC